MLLLPTTGKLPISMTSSTATSWSFMRLDVMPRVRLIERMSALAVRFPRGVVRTVFYAVMLIVGIIANLKVARPIISGVAIAMVYLSTYAVTDERGIYEAVH